MEDDIENRLLKLEETVAHQALTIEELSDELAREAALSSEMKRKLDRLTERFLELEETTREPTPVTRPPHY